MLCNVEHNADLRKIFGTITLWEGFNYYVLQTMEKESHPLALFIDCTCALAPLNDNTEMVA